MHLSNDKFCIWIWLPINTNRKTHSNWLEIVFVKWASLYDIKTIQNLKKKQSKQLRVYRTFEYRKWFSIRFDSIRFTTLFMLFLFLLLFQFICSASNGQIVGASITVTADCNARRFYETDKFAMCHLSYIFKRQST